MQPVEFIAKWKAVEQTERAASHSHFNDLCALLGEQTPTDADHIGTHYCFERGVTKTTGGKGWADVWKRECFAWEYKGKHKDLTAAFVQLQRYALALENPPLLVVCDFDRIRIHTNWTNSVSEIHEFTLDDLRDAQKRQTIKAMWSDPERLKPGKTRAELTEEAAAEFALLAQRLRARGNKPEETARFINRLVFCMFAEDADLLPGQMFKRMLEHAKRRPDEFTSLGSDLFRAMQSGGRIGFEHVDWFNGGLFNDDTAIPLEREDIDAVLRVAELDWSQIDTSILGTLFERGLDPSKRSQLGAHYTDKEKIMLIVEPNIIRPWLLEWEGVKSTITSLMEAPRRRGKKNGQYSLALGTYRSFMTRLRSFRVLDPACGSGNFLYLALQALKDIEHKVSIEAEALGITREWPEIGPEAVKGIEINTYAAELARMTVWIGEIQWMRRNGFDVSKNPILKPLDTIECRDALINTDEKEAAWPVADVIIGNPPFLGTKRMYGVLGVDYTKALRKLYEGRVSPFSDLVCWWFAKAEEAVTQGSTIRAGLVATNSIRGGKNRVVLDSITQHDRIFDAWADEPWVVDGAAVRVSIISFGRDEDATGLGQRLNGRPVIGIHSDLTAANDQDVLGADLTLAARLTENRSTSFVGTVKAGAFDLEGDEARTLLKLPSNPNGRPNSDVVRRWVNGLDVVRRPQDKWIIDFGVMMSEEEAALYEQPFRIAYDRVRPARLQVRRPKYRDYWWLEAEPCGGMRAALTNLSRFIVTPAVAKHRVFAWMDAKIQPDHQLIAVARDDDTTFGILHSRFHEAWALGLCTWLGVGNDPRYTPTTTFETFPFPEGLAPDRDPAFYATDARAMSIAAAAHRLDIRRQNWLNPPELVRAEPEVVPGYPDRILPIDDAAAALLKTRTLTNLYNERPTWLVNAHRDLDEAVAAAYGWPADIAVEDVLARLLALNLARAAEGGPVRRRPASQRLRREPELPPMPIPGGRTSDPQQIPVAEPAAQPAQRTGRRRTRRGA